MISIFKKLGPGLLFAGAAIGVSHLVQSTRAGADFGYGLIWALLLVNVVKYPFFQFGPRYAMATDESLLEGYKRLGKGVLAAYYILNLGTMFTIHSDRYHSRRPLGLTDISSDQAFHDACFVRSVSAGCCLGCA